MSQDLSPGLAGDWCPMTSQETLCDKPNEMMFEQLLAEFERINDREVDLSARDNVMIPEIIRGRQRSSFKFPQSSVPASAASGLPQPSVASRGNSDQSQSTLLSIDQSQVTASRSPGDT